MSAAVAGEEPPDLIVAVVIAGLFLHSSSKIVRTARREMTPAVTPT